MHNFELHPEFYNQLILLTEDEKQNPLSVIQEFFGEVKLIEVRIHMYNLLQVALTTSNAMYDDARDRDVILCFVKQLERVLEATSIVGISDITKLIGFCSH